MHEVPSDCVGTEFPIRKISIKKQDCEVTSATLPSTFSSSEWSGHRKRGGFFLTNAGSLLRILWSRTVVSQRCIRGRWKKMVVEVLSKST